LLFSLAFVALAIMPSIRPAQAYVQAPIWIPPYAFKGYEDTYYYTNIVAYTNGSTVPIKIPVSGSFSDGTNVTFVSMKFDWGLNVTSDYRLNPVRIDYGDMHYFDLSFMANINDASWLWAHTWTIDVRYSYYGYNYSWTYTPGYYFVVFSQDQVDTRTLASEYNALVNGYYPNTVGARLLKQQAISEATVAVNSMEKGNFTESKAHYQQAISLIQQSMDSEGTRGGALEDAQLNVTLTEASASMKQADAAMIEASATLKEADAAMIEANATKTQADAAVMVANATLNQSYAWILFGIGVIIISIGILTYAIKKPKTL